MTKVIFGILFWAALNLNLMGQDGVVFSVTPSASDPLMLDCCVKNENSSGTIVIMKAALASDGTSWAYPNARYYFVVLFPDGDAGERVEECFGSVSGAYPNPIDKTVIKLKPGEEYHFSRLIVANNEKLTGRLRSDPFLLYWYVAIYYRVERHDKDEHKPEKPDQYYVGRFHGFSRIGNSHADLADPTSNGPRLP